MTKNKKINNKEFKTAETFARSGNGFRGFFSLFFFLFSFFSYSQVTSSIDSTSIQIGEEIKYSIEVEADTTALVVFPEGQTFLPLEVIESYKIDTTFEQAKYRLIKKYGLTQFDSGKYTIPRQRIIINNATFETDSVQVEVRDVAVDTLKQKMFDIKAAVDVEKPPFDYLKLLFWLVPILIIGVLVYFFLRRKKRKAEEQRELPPYEEAIVALKNLDNTPFLRENKSKEYYTQLTEIVKRYLDREVDDAALESTSDELITRLQMHKDAGHFDFDSETISHLDQILKRADLVKFAKMSQQQGQAEADRATIEEIINETHEVIPEPSEEELLENEIYKETLRKKKERKKWILSISGVFVAFLLTAIVYGSIAGFSSLKDLVFGNNIRELAEGRWIKSEYGYPAVILETPEVLVRTEIENPETGNIIVQNKDVFTFGDLQNPFYINVSTTRFNEPQELELEAAMEEALTQLEKTGAENMLVKTESFQTDKGITGIKAYGEFNVRVSDKKVMNEPISYELLLFVQQNGLQQVLIVFQNDGRFAEEIKERILNSVELEISEKQ